jgi:hypothetical protein
LKALWAGIGQFTKKGSFSYQSGKKKSRFTQIRQRMIPPRSGLRHLQKTIQYGGKAVQFKNKILRLVMQAASIHGRQVAVTIIASTVSGVGIIDGSR